MPLYTFIHNLLNVLVQIANEMGLQKKNLLTCNVALKYDFPLLQMFVYEDYGTLGFATNVVLLIIVGFLVNGPYALITTAVSADLGTHHSLEGNAKALATVSAIIDGTGSIGV
jgi:OPA family glycerol-3-phosphate transporter-like MFS transporter 1/2